MYRISNEVLEALIKMPEASVSGDRGMEAFFNPPASIQQYFNFTDLTVACNDAHGFLNHLLGLIENPPHRVLDFGCGWGRIMRLLSFSKVFDGAKMDACDVDPNGLRFIDRAIPGVTTKRTTEFPPTPYDDGAFDLVYAYSVFTHLSLECNIAWGKEFRRITSRGGIVCVTTQGENFLRYCNRNQDAPLPKIIPSLSRDEAIDRYRSGEFLYSLWLPDKPHYGHAAVPRKFFEKTWEPLGFEIIDWDESRSQACCTMKAI